MIASVASRYFHGPCTSVRSLPWGLRSQQLFPTRMFLHIPVSASDAVAHMVIEKGLSGPRIQGNRAFNVYCLGVRGGEPMWWGWNAGARKDSLFTHLLAVAVGSWEVAVGTLG